eukprot:scaffold143_cov260-Pinguiococcus_pyrenoidosus.AAC.38
MTAATPRSSAWSYCERRAKACRRILERFNNEMAAVAVPSRCLVLVGSSRYGHWDPGQIMVGHVRGGALLVSCKWFEQCCAPQQHLE